MRSCDYILCEDTRHSLTLLQHYDIKKPLKSYHKFNETASLEHILTDLKQGKSICLISDAGTPGIADPGEILVKACIAEDIALCAIPGPCAIIQAIVCSGFPTQPFQFCGFLAKKEGELKRQLQQILLYAGVSVCYASPHQLLKVLEAIDGMQKERPLVIARELTKKFEEYKRGTAQEISQHFETHPLKGECVLVVSPPPEKQGEDWTHMTPKEHVEWIEETYDLARKDAIKLVAELRGSAKRAIYQEMIEDKEKHAEVENE